MWRSLESLPAASPSACWPSPARPRQLSALLVLPRPLPAAASAPPPRTMLKQPCSGLPEELGSPFASREEQPFAEPPDPP